ncbi:MAG: CRISPR system precrRNA processing endoribonuclease RAMP protein Cas6, partial [Victivallales bacterium]|nr:CRISPR system precrRNA processing endoribonuclease RAMP protein Cas6 [Victivallales bacterium]
MGLGKRHQVCQCKLLSVKKVTPPTPAYAGNEDLAVQFVTPANRITFHGTKFTEEIPFLPMFNRLTWRVAELDTLYGDDTIKPQLDIPALQEAAATIGHRRVSGGFVAAQRTSTRTAQVQYLDGFVGEMRYRGNFTPFLPILAYLPYVNVGHFNEGGCGWCQMKFVPPDQ